MCLCAISSTSSLVSPTTRTTDRNLQLQTVCSSFCLSLKGGGICLPPKPRNWRRRAMARSSALWCSAPCGTPPARAAQLPWAATTFSLFEKAPPCYACRRTRRLHARKAIGTPCGCGCLQCKMVVLHIPAVGSGPCRPGFLLDGCFHQHVTSVVAPVGFLVFSSEGGVGSETTRL